MSDPERAVLPGRHRRPGGGPREGERHRLPGLGRQPRAAELGGRVHAGGGRDGRTTSTQARPRTRARRSPPFRMASSSASSCSGTTRSAPLTNDFALDFYNANTSAFIGTINRTMSPPGCRRRGDAQRRRRWHDLRDGDPARLRVRGTPHLKWIANGSFTGSLPAEYPGTSGAIDPDAASARGAITVAAVQAQRRRPEHRRVVQLARTDGHPLLRQGRQQARHAGRAPEARPRRGRRCRGQLRVRHRVPGPQPLLRHERRGPERGRRRGGRLVGEAVA